MANFAIMRTGKVKSVASIANLEKHCSREKMPKNADQERTVLNRSLLPDPDGLTLPDRFAKMTEGQKIRKNAVLGIEVMMTFTPEAVPKDEKLSSWVKSNQEWLAKEFGEKNVVRCWLHMDEHTPHLHAFVVPLDEKGKLNCRHYLGGSDKLSALQDRYAEAMEPYSLERGIKGSKARHKTVKEFYRAIEDANRQDLPEPTKTTEKGLFGANKTVAEPVEEYYKRANAAFKQQHMQLVNAAEQLRKEKVKAKQADKYRRKAETFDKLNKGLSRMRDQEHAMDLRKELQDIVDSSNRRPAPMRLER